MAYASIIGWGKCLPPGVLTNEDLATFLETDDQWITTRNMSAATVPVALVEAMEEGRVNTPRSLILMPAFGGGLTLCADLVRWGDRVQPLGSTDIDLPPSPKSAREIVNELRKRKAPHGRPLQLSGPPDLSRSGRCGFVYGKKTGDLTEKVIKAFNSEE